MTDSDPPPRERELAEEVVQALVRLAQADFTVRLPRSFKRDNADLLAMFVNLIAEELARLTKERESQKAELERGVERLSEAFLALAAGDFSVRVPRTQKGDALDVLAYLLDNTAAEVGDAFAEIDRQRRVLETILDSMVDGVLLLDVQGRVLRANHAVAALLRWPMPADMAGEPIERLVAPKDQEIVGQIAKLAEGEPFRDRDIVFSTLTGELLPMTVNASAVVGKGGVVEGVVVVTRDNRQLKKVQAQLQLADRLATMGTLAAGVAHEINNPLSFVASNLDFVVDELEHTHGALDADRYAEVMKALKASQGGAERVRLIVRDLRAFARVEQDAIVRLDLSRLLDAAANMIRNEVRHHARLEKEYGPVPLVDANEPRLVQVFLNLIQNATQAIPAGNVSQNEIRLVTGTTAAGEAFAEVSDTGSGITDAHLPHVFDAFYTTKAVGVGTGLGLAICHKIVSSFGGRIEVETKVGEGTKFRVVLPAARLGDTPKPARRSVPPNSGAGERRRVLVIDDEVEVGESFRRMLGKAHDVVATTRAADALELLRQGPFDVVFCDLMMPEMTGMDLYRRLVGEMPAVAESMVFITGGTFGSGVAQFLESVGNERVDKPFDWKRVLTIVEGRESRETR